MTVESQTDPRPSLAELRAMERELRAGHYHTHEGSICAACEVLKALPALLDIAEAAQALDTALLHDAVAGDAAKLTIDDLDDALSKVKP